MKLLRITLSQLLLSDVIIVARKQRRNAAVAFLIFVTITLLMTSAVIANGRKVTMENKILWAKEDKAIEADKSGRILGYIFLAMILMPILAFIVGMSVRIFFYFMGR